MALVRPTSAFVSMVEGYPITLGPADILEDSNPHVTANPTCFEPVRATFPGTGGEVMLERGGRRPK